MSQALHGVLSGPTIVSPISIKRQHFCRSLRSVNKTNCRKSMKTADLGCRCLFRNKVHFADDITHIRISVSGYGDLYPRTALGYIIGTVCAVCGLLMLSLPVPVILSKFTLYYSHAQARQKLPKKSKKSVLLSAASALIDPDATDLMAEETASVCKETGSRRSMERTSSDDSAIGSSYGIHYY